MSARRRPRVIVGVWDHAGHAIFVTVTRDGAVVDRRRVVLLEPGLPAMPHHHEGQRLPIEEAVALVARVRASAEAQARLRLEELSRALPHVELTGVALRVDPPLPPTVAERIASYRAMCVADWVMYRRALGDAALARGWSEHRFDAKTVLEGKQLDALFESARTALGPPWTKEHRLAMAGAIAAYGQ